MKRRLTRSPKSAKRRLLFALTLFVLMLSAPIYLLFDRVYQQLDNEQFFSASRAAEGLAERIDRALQAALQKEQERPIAEYRFFNVQENPLLKGSALKLSPLSELPPKTDVAGLVGFFQIDADGSFQIPALPDLTQGDSSRLTPSELAKRQALRDRLKTLLSSASAPSSQRPVDAPALKDEKNRAKNEGYVVEQEADFRKQEVLSAQPKTDTVSKEQLERWNIDSGAWDKEYEQKAPAKKKANVPVYRSRKETVKLPEQSVASNWRRSAVSEDSASVLGLSDAMEESRQNVAQAAPPMVSALEPKNPVVLSFESEVGPLQMLPLSDRNLCFYRQVWHRNSRLTQGFVVDAEPFWQATVQPLLSGGLASSILLLYQGQLNLRLGGHGNGKEILLYRGTLLPPFQNYELIVNSMALDEGPGKWVVDMLALALIAIVSIGLALFYRLVAKQIDLAHQQSNFIAAVSHELKTPLTSIRMYGEMLRSGWVADDTKKQGYYDYIFFESERLSRLIANVLQLARIENGRAKTELNPFTTQELLVRLTGKIAALIDASEFKLSAEVHADVKDKFVKVNEDAFYQIVINLIDNAIKFAAAAEVKQIDVGFRPGKGKQEVLFFVRDYGPGIPKKQMRKIFDLFYRGQDEMTRTTPGTGIGLALARELAEGIEAKLVAENRRTGVEFQLVFG